MSPLSDVFPCRPTVSLLTRSIRKLRLDNSSASQPQHLAPPHTMSMHKLHALTPLGFTVDDRSNAICAIWSAPLPLKLWARLTYASGITVNSKRGPPVISYAHPQLGCCASPPP
ncbi:hypothetical protein P3342_003042 [Pyrenophora teres f. teres]|nr:hypothetical protein P3342_003042 [Pyrenophora teres f. teres]